MPSLAAVKAASQEAGFNSIATDLYTVQPNVQNLFLYDGKHHPGLYLNPSVRVEISTFVWLATDDEVQ